MLGKAISFIPYIYCYDSLTRTEIVALEMFGTVVPDWSDDEDYKCDSGSYWVRTKYENYQQVWFYEITGIEE